MVVVRTRVHNRRHPPQFNENEELIGVLAAQWGDYGLPPEQRFWRARDDRQSLLRRRQLSGGWREPDRRNHRAVD